MKTPAPAKAAFAALLLATFSGFACAQHEDVTQNSGFIQLHPDMYWHALGQRALKRNRLGEAFSDFRRSARYADKASQAVVAAMLWNGWGDPGRATTLPLAVRALLPALLGRVQRSATAPELAEVVVRPSRLSAAQRAALAAALHMDADEFERVLSEHRGCVEDTFRNAFRLAGVGDGETAAAGRAPIAASHSCTSRSLADQSRARAAYAGSSASR